MAAMFRALQGVLLFLFIPLVLYLFLRQPLGPAVSVALGLALMAGHRFVAEPWARRRAPERCAWCGRGRGGRPGGAWQTLDVLAGGRPWQVGACGPSHAALSGRFLSLTRRCRVPIAAGNLIPLALLLSGSLALAAGWPFLSPDANGLQFRLVVALTVVSASLAYRAVRVPDERLVSVFPLHNLLLLGLRQTLWVFRLVGAWWIVEGLRRVG